MSERTSETHHFLVYGQVQRVGYRNWAQQCAQSDALTGWIRNRPDGRVEIMASGAPERLQRYQAALSKGPAEAKVVRVDARKAKPKDFQEFTRKPTGPKGEEDISDIVLSLDPAFLAACQRAYRSLSPATRLMNWFPRKQGKWRFGQIDTAADKCGIDLVHLGPNAPPNLLCQTQTLRFGLDVSRPSWVGPMTEELSNNKFLTKIVLKACDVPVPTGVICRTAAEARAAFERIDGAVVVKPVFGTEAKGVTLNVSSAQACESAFDYAMSQGMKGLVLVEEYMRGVDLRLLLLGEKIIAAYLRLPANVVGDGQTSIADLVAEKNAARISLPSTQDGHLIKLGLKQRRLLSLQGYARKDVPEPGQIVLLGVSPNYVDGADLVPITDLLHPDVSALAQQTARAIDPTAFWGLDLLTEDFAAAKGKARTVICEVNSRPVGGVFRHATHAKHVHFFEEVFEEVFENPSRYQPRAQAPAKQIAQVPPPDARARFETQVVDIITHERPDILQLTPNILAQKLSASTAFHIVNPNPSFVRGVLTPWRWMELRGELEKRGIPMTPLSTAPPEHTPKGNDATPLGRAFLVKPRAKMMTFWVENANRLDKVQHDYPEWRITLELFETPVSLEVAFIGAKPVAAAKISYEPLFATGDLSNRDLLASALVQKRGGTTVAAGEYRKHVWRPKQVMSAQAPVAQPQVVARLAGRISVQTEMDSDIRATCAALQSLIPGFVLGTVVFRLRENGAWGVSEIYSRIDTRPFLCPDHGDVVNLARFQAEHALANPQIFDLNLPWELLTQAAI